ncbi:MAG: hypothetical protein OEY97_09360 [Nitrospirota bacterium]|nr:hypothetical protein [Nitrospirota bacterium]
MTGLITVLSVGAGMLMVVEMMARARRPVRVRVRAERGRCRRR